jgi:lipopolysaccharide export LptBFGC system permease protein LptF
MRFLEDKLEALDTYFESKKVNEKWMLILSSAGLITFISYTYLLPYTEKMYKKSETTKKSMQKSIINNNTYLNSITVSGDRNYYVKKFDNEIERKEKNIIRINKNIKFIDKNLEKLSDMLFNQKSWSKFLNSITHKAKVQDVDIQYISNKYVGSKGNFGHVLEIGLGCKGEYKSIVKFINEIEQNVLVTDIYGTRFSSDQNSSVIMADINISVWGINH